MVVKRIDISAKKPFERHMYSLMHKGYNVGSVFRDLLDVALYTFLNNNIATVRDELWQKREDEFNSIVEKYKRNNCGELMTQLFSDLIEVMEDKTQSYKRDYLGSFYENNVTFGENGQFFTPIHVCEMMNQVVEPKEGEKICDPCCGSGRFLYGPGKKGAIITGIDIDRRCAIMSVLNLFLNGISGTIYRGDSLRFELHCGWSFGFKWGMPRMVEIQKEDINIGESQKEQIQAGAEQTINASEYKQASLFTL